MRFSAVFFLFASIACYHSNAFTVFAHKPLATSLQAATRNSRSLNRRSSSNLHMQHPVICATAQAASAASINAAALRAIAKLISTCGLGVVAGKVGLLDKAALSVLSKLVFGLFQPCLLFVNVASTVAKLGGTGGPVSLLPFAAALQILIGYTVGKFVSAIIYRNDQKSEEAKQLLTCTTFGNSGPLPLVFVDALLRTHADATLLPKSVAFVSLYLLGWSPLFWIFAPAILADEKDVNAKEQSQKEKMTVLAKRILSPPVLGSLFGMIVGAVPFIRHMFLPATGAFHPIFEAARTLGAGYLPAVLLVLAGSLTPPPPNKDAPATTAVVDNKKENIAFAKQIGAIYAARFLLMPTLGFAIIEAARRYFPSLKSLLSDPVLVFVLLLETCMPSAQNSTVILQLQGKGAAAARMAKALMAIYVLGVPAISYWLVKILSATNLAC